MDPVASEVDATSRLERRRAATRARLIDAAAGVFATKGIESATIADLTEAADVGLGTFYNYFENKDEIVAAVTERMADLLGSRLERALATQDQPERGLAAMVHELFAWHEEEPGWGAFLLAIGMHSETVVQRVGGLLLEVIGRGRAMGGFHPKHAELAAISIAGVLVAGLGFAAQNLLPPDARTGFASHALRLVGVSASAADEIAADVGALRAAPVRGRRRA